MSENQNQPPVDSLDPSIGVTNPALEIRKRFSAIAVNIQRIISLPIFLDHGTPLQRGCILAKGWSKKGELLYIPFLVRNLGK